MEGEFDGAVLTQVPLAQSVLTLMRWALDADQLALRYQDHRGRCHDRLLSFPTFVGLLFDSLTVPWTSARNALLKAQDAGRLPVSLKAFYDKLKNTPVGVSLELFRDPAARLRAIVPDDRPGCPASLQGMSTLLLDGKVVKHVQRRLKVLRRDQATAFKLLGPRTLVLADRWSGLVHDWVADLDGEVNEVKYAAALVRRVPGTVPGPWLIVGDRAFGIFGVCQDIQDQGGHFLLRQHGMTRFVPDPERPAVHSTDRFGRPVRQQWGWLVRGKGDRERIAARQITVQRSKGVLVLVTDLLDPDRYPVDDLLETYLARWDIEGIFQTVTEVFHLRTLFSSSPQGMLAQMALCFLMYTVVRLVQGFIARAHGCEPKSISTELLFRDIQEELIALKRMLPLERVVAQVRAFATAEEVRLHVEALLQPCWCNRWKKANHRPRNPAKPPAAKPVRVRQRKGHDSVQRILELRQ
jgi:Transposase DDE domain